MSDSPKTTTSNIFKEETETPNRIYPDEDEHPYRKGYQRDRDRIMYSKPFRRLSGKTQVLPPQIDDHIRTRLTHSLEVAQIARTIAKKLNFNEDLCEAIALGHDVGHTPFGHAAERELDKLLKCNKDNPLADNPIIKNLKNDDCGFKHSLQSARILMKRDMGSSGAERSNNHGLNLSLKTLWGIIHHTDAKKLIDFPFYQNAAGFKEVLNKQNATLEALIVKYADEIAQRHHDIEDAIDQDLICPKEFSIKFAKKITYLPSYEINQINKNLIINDFSRAIVNHLVTSFIDSLKQAHTEVGTRMKLSKREDLNDETIHKVYEEVENEIRNSQFVTDLDDLEKEIKTRILNSRQTQLYDQQGIIIVGRLFKAFINNPNFLKDNTINILAQELNLGKELTPTVRNLIQKNSSELLINNAGKFCRVVADHIACMTDSYAKKTIKEIDGH